MADPKLIPQLTGPLTIWRQPVPGRTYACGVDTAGGKSTDDWSTMTVVDTRTLEDVAFWRAHIDPSELGEIVPALANLYGGKLGQAFMVIEINNHGLATLESARLSGGWNFYCRRTWDRIQKDWSDALGFSTSMKTRPILINRAREAIRDPDIRINNPLVLEEAMTFIRKDSGKEEHQEGCHDDALMSWMLALEGAALFETGSAPGEPAVVADEVDPVDEIALRRQEQSWIWKGLAVAEASQNRPVSRVVSRTRGSRHVRMV